MNAIKYIIFSSFLLIVFVINTKISMAQGEDCSIQAPGVITTVSCDIVLTENWYDLETAYHRAENSAFINPNLGYQQILLSIDMAWGLQETSFPHGPIGFPSYSLENDGGFSFNEIDPFDGQNGLFMWQADPCVAIDNDGTEYYAGLYELNLCANYRTMDGSWAEGSGAGQFFIGNITPWGESKSESDPLNTEPWAITKVGWDKPHLWVDNSINSEFKGNVYIAALKYDEDNLNQKEFHIYFSKIAEMNEPDNTNWCVDEASGPGACVSCYGSCIDLCDYFETPLELTYNFHHGVNIQTGPLGEIYAVWAIQSISSNFSLSSPEKAIAFSSTNNPAIPSFSSKIIIDNIHGVDVTESNNPVNKGHRVNSFPVMAVDISGGIYNGNIYVVWANKGLPQNNNQGDEVNVLLIKSTDGGATWNNENPIQVNHHTDLKVSYSPWLTCDQVTGNLHVIFYDDRSVDDPDNVEVWCANSFDGGDSWEDFKVSDVEFNPQPWPSDMSAGNFMGDYISITAHDGWVFPIWTDTRDTYEGIALNGLSLSYCSPYQVDCSNEWDLSTQTISNGQILTKKAINLITVHGESPGFVINSGGEVDLQCENEIAILPNFHAQPGSDFEAKIGACSYTSNNKSTITYPDEIYHLFKKGESPDPVKDCFKIHPNPNTGIVNIDFYSDMIMDGKIIQIYNLKGNLIMEFLSQGSNNEVIDLTGNPKGLYLIKINNGDQVYTEKIVYQ